MSVNYGSNKIGKINVGSSAIGKVYQGSTLVFQSGLGMPVYGAKFYLQDLEFPTFLFASSIDKICKILYNYYGEISRRKHVNSRKKKKYTLLFPVKSILL